MVESASKQFIGLLIKHLVEDSFTYHQHINHTNSSINNRNHHSEIVAKRSQKKCKRLLNRANLNRHQSEDTRIVQLKEDFIPLDIIIGHQQQPSAKKPIFAIERQNLNQDHGRQKRFVFIADIEILPKYNRLNLKYFSSRKTAKRLRYLLSLDAKKKPR